MKKQIEEALISVIVPVYNVAKYLKKCIESILNQSYHNLEIILVDDGSNDESSIICDMYAERDSRIKVVHKENGGITSARRAGIQESHGMYITFVDGDDWIEHNMYLRLVDHIQKNGVEIIASGMYRDNEGGTYALWPPAQFKAGVYKAEEKLSKIDRNLLHKGSQNISGSLNNKIIKTDIVKTNINKMDDNIHGNADDIVLLFLCILDAESIEIVSDAYYHGYDRSDSSTHTKNNYWFSQMELAYQILAKRFRAHAFAETLIEQLNLYITNNMLQGIVQLTGKNYLPRYVFYMPSLYFKELVICGAGKVGQSFYAQMVASDLYKVVKWVDKDWEKYSQEGLAVESISSVKNEKFDYIVIATVYENIAREMKQELLTLGVEPKSVIWRMPISLIEYFSIKD